MYNVRWVISRFQFDVGGGEGVASNSKPCSVICNHLAHKTPMHSGQGGNTNPWYAWSLSCIFSWTITIMYVFSKTKTFLHGQRLSSKFSCLETFMHIFISQNLYAYFDMHPNEPLVHDNPAWKDSCIYEESQKSLEVSFNQQQLKSYRGKKTKNEYEDVSKNVLWLQMYLQLLECHLLMK